MDYNTIKSKYILRYNKIKQLTNKTLNDQGTLLELYYCITHNNTYLWNDIDNNIKLKYKYTYYDSGIDCATLDENNNIISIIQCKNYNGCLNTVNLEGFNYNCIKTLKSKINNIKLILCISSTTKLCKQLKEDKLYEIEQLTLPDKINENDTDKKNDDKQINKQINKQIKLRDYQKECLNRMNKFINNNEYSNNKRFIVQIPCGCGKTVIIHEFCKMWIKQEKKNENETEINQEKETINNQNKKQVKKKRINQIKKQENNPSSNQENNLSSNPSSNQENNPSFNPSSNQENNPSFNPSSNQENNPSFNPFFNSSSNPSSNSFLDPSESKKILILVPSQLLVEQFLKEFNDIKCNYLLTNHEKYDDNNNLTICCYNSIYNVMNYEFDFVIIDEAHHIQRPRIYRNEKNPDNNTQYLDIIKFHLKSKFEFYFSATIDNPDFVYTMDQAIEQKYLNDYQVEIHNITDNRFNSCRLILQNSSYQKTVIYCNDINTCNNLNEYLIQNGLKSMSLTSMLNKQKRKYIINKFKNDEINILCSVNCLSEGINIPCIDTCIFFDDRSSIINIIQCLGRCLRLYPTKIKAKMIILSSKENKDKNYNKYLEAISFSDKFFNENYKNKLLFKYEKDNSNNMNDIQYNNLLYNLTVKDYGLFDTMIIKRRTLEEKINICNDYYLTFKCLPEKGEIFKGLNVYNFIGDIIKKVKSDKNIENNQDNNQDNENENKQDNETEINQEPINDNKQELNKVFNKKFSNKKTTKKSKQNNSKQIDPNEILKELNNIFEYDFIKYGLNHENLFINQPDTSRYSKVKKIPSFSFKNNKWIYYSLNLEHLKKIVLQKHILKNDLQFIKRLNDIKLLNGFNKFEQNDFEKGKYLTRDWNFVDKIDYYSYENLDDKMNFKLFLQIRLNKNINIFNGNTINEKKDEFINFCINKIKEILKEKYNYSDDKLKYILQIKNNHNQSTNEIHFNLIFYNLICNSDCNDLEDKINLINEGLKENKWNITNNLISYDNNKPYLYNNIHFIHQSKDNITYFNNVINPIEFLKDKNTLITPIIIKLLKEYVFELSLINV